MTGPVLVVDDDDDIRDTIVAVLEDEGLPVRGAANGREALDLMQRERPCLVLLDLMMPVMTGAELVAEMRGDVALAPIPVVLLSAWSRDAGRVEAVQGRLHKPVGLTALLDVVSRYCEI